MTERTDQLHVLASRVEVTRRDAIKLFASGIAALEAGCMTAAGDEEIVPYVTDPPELRPGVPQRYASVLALDGFGTGVIVETRDGRPIKLDGNPAHPASAGGSTPILQARILELYDPQRSCEVTIDGAPGTWHEIARRLQASSGPLWLVMPPQSSPTVRALLDRLATRREIRVVFDTPLDRRAVYRGHELAFGRPLEHQPDLARADRVVALDSDFMATGPMAPVWARAAASRRMPTARMSRLWVCEPMPTPTGTLADERLAIPARDVAAVAACVLARLGRRGLRVPPIDATTAIARLGRHEAWAASLADDLASHRGAVTVIAGDRQPPIVHLLARWIEHACETPIACSAPALLDPLGARTMDELVAAAPAAVIVIDADPIYTSPHHTQLRELLARTPFSIHVGLHRTATARACHAHVPLAHELETWTDPRAYDGTLAIGQPAIRPRFEVVSLLELLGMLLGDHRDARELVFEHFQHAGVARADRVPTSWTDALRTGVVDGTRAVVTTETPAWPHTAAGELARAIESTGPFEIALASSQVHDGRFASNAWLQELPHPITKQTWGNAALMSAATAERLGVVDGDLATAITAAGTLDLPALIVAGAADNSITIELGYGQIADESPIADRLGTDAYPLRGDDRRLLGGLVLAAPGRRQIVRTQHTMTEHDREVAPIATLAHFLDDPEVTAHLRGEQPSLLPARSRDGTQWGMSIDTSICTGCSACMVACQAENNIPVVGPDDVARGRHMNWIRIDRYLVDGGAVVNEPMPCQHCENAPCEYVCPVMATTHSPDGLNEQVYNRCVGTRFCSNNCPYKVRRFNWFAYEAPETSARELQYNPDVTVRSRGVMEKCTYCVQRIRRAEHAALVEHRAIRTGEVVTACQQACPTGAIQFGELHETGTSFARMRVDSRRFDVLFDLGTRPRTQYLAKIRNPKGEP